MPETYWAIQDPDTLAREVLSRWKDWRRYFWQSGVGAKADKGRRYYYGMNDLGENSSRLQTGGNAAQFLKVVLNKVRPAVKRALAMIAGQEPKMVPVAANSDAGAREQAISSKGILEHYHRELDTDALDREALEIAMCMGEAYRLTLWDATLGEEEAVDPDSEQPIHSGDFALHVLTPFDVARDTSLRSRRGWPWVITRTWESRWEWAARVPEKAEQILAARERGEDLEYGFDMRMGMSDLLNKGDMIPVYRFFHVKGKAVRGGRAFTCLNEGTWLEDGDLPYEGLPIAGISPGGVISTSLGHSDVFDALGIADLLNSMHTVVATHTTRWGIPPIIDYVGSGIQHSVLGNGISVVTVKSREYKPDPLDVPPIPADVFAHLEKLGEEIFEVLGMNSTAMGNPPFAGMPAQLAAILDQKAREYHEGLAKSNTSYKQAVATQELAILKAFATTPRIAVIQGKAEQWMLKSFTGSDLQHVKRVAMEAAPQGTGTLAFKLATVEILQKFGVELPAQDIVNLLRTGEYESAFEADEANRLRIKAENEGLQEGKEPPVLMARTHWIDILEHLSLLGPPDIIEKPHVVAAVMNTVAAKLEMWRAMPADLLQLLGGPPPPRPTGPAGAMAAPGEAAPQGAQPAPEGAPVPEEGLQ